jgi:hypothetical protein
MSLSGLRNGGLFKARQVRTSFFKKKKQKNFCSCGRWQHRGHGPPEQKFFGYFFSKK